MAGSKEIRNQIKSTQNTQKITKAMEMVAASKMRKAQERMEATRPYAERMRAVIGHLANAHPEYRHPYLVDREVKRVGVIVISSDRGLCGGLNTNLFRETVKAMEQFDNDDVDVDICTIGSKGTAFFKRLGGNIVADKSKLGDRPHLTDVIGAVKVMLDAYDEGRIDALHLARNHFESAMAQRPEVAQVIPVPQVEEESLKHHWDYIYEPEAKEVLDTLLTRYIESQVYQAVVENVACEMAARMIAMKSASDNAGDIIKDLKLAYNKARQAAITQEIAEIVGGASAV